MLNRSFVWLIGENKGKTHDNNSYYFWIAASSVEDDIRKFYILENNSQNRSFKKSLSKERQNLIVWKDSLKHYWLYMNADMGIVSLSYLDVVPEKLLGKKKKYWGQFPIVYLQHGVTGQKKLGYKGDAYNGNLCRFVYYNRNIKETLVKENGFKSTQLLYGAYFPRYAELLRKCENPNASSRVKEVLWFVTWREYGDKSIEYKKVIASMLATIESDSLSQALKRKGIRLKVCLHRQMMGSMVKELSQMADGGCVDIVDASEVDVLSLIARSDALITDYSSVAYDFAFLEKPVIIYAPDFDDYSSMRGLYYTSDNVRDCFCSDLSGLVEKIDQDEWCVPKYFRSAFPAAIEYDKIREGLYIRRLYDYLNKLQHSEITFLGYNFYGTGGTVSATRALAEALFDRGFLVHMLSLKGSMRSPKSTRGIKYSRFYVPGDNSRIQRLRLFLHRGKKGFEPIKHDCLKDNLVPYVGYSLNRYLSLTSSSLVVSTRESLHVSLLDSGFSGKKGFFWHTRADALDDIYPGLLRSYSGKTFHGSLFTTSENRDELKSLGISIPEGLVLGNTLISSQILNKDEALALRREKYQNRDSFFKLADGIPFESKYINCVTLMRLSAERKDAISRIIEFASYLSNQETDRGIRLYVYGEGELLGSLIEELYKRNATSVIRVMGKTDNPAQVLRKADFMVDFSEVQSFGMPTIEAVFNGCLPLVRHNVGSDALIESESSCFWVDIQELIDKMTISSASDNDEYGRLREGISKNYSPEVLSQKFIDYFGIEAPLIESVD